MKFKPINWGTTGRKSSIEIAVDRERLEREIGAKFKERDNA